MGRSSHASGVALAMLPVAEEYKKILQDLMKLASDAVVGLPGNGGFLAALFSPDRWLLRLRVLFVLSVYHFPTGGVGRLRARGCKG